MIALSRRPTSNSLSCLRAACFAVFLTIAASYTAQQPAWSSNQEAVVLNNDGVKALNNGNFDLAITKFEAALKVDPSYKVARDNLEIARKNMAKQPSQNTD